MELEKIVIILINRLKLNVSILIGKDQIGIDLKSLLELEFLKTSSHGKVVVLG